MKGQIQVIIVLAFILMSGLAYWQIRNLQLNEALASENEKKEMHATLVSTAIEIRKLQANDEDLKFDLDRMKVLTKDLIDKNFVAFESEFQWAYFDGLGHPLDSLNFDVDTAALSNAPIKLCSSCFVLIRMVSKEEDITTGEFTLEHTPAQMHSIEGLDLKDLRFIHILRAQKPFSISNYLAPFIFLAGLLFLIFWLYFLNSKQRKLIHQKNEFVNHLSHQFQTPLSSIKLSANLMANHSTKNKEELVQIIQTESTRLENHIKTILHWVKSDADRLKISKEKVLMTDIIEQSLKQMKPVFLSNKTIINFIPPSEELTILADRNHLQLMLFNIWENAIKHNENPVTITISCNKNKSTTQIIIEDNGVGMTDIKNDFTYKGLGLEYIMRIMKEHNGSMYLSSIAGKGLTAELKFQNYG